MVTEFAAVWLFVFAAIEAGSGGVKSDGNHHRQKRESTCYQRLGCFSNDYPYNNNDGLLPQNPDFIQTTFYLFTRTNPTQPNTVAAGEPFEQGFINFIPNVTTTFIIHGFIQHAEVDWVKNMTLALLNRDNMNVIAVDWARGSGFPYTQAATNTRVVGAEVAALIQSMVDHGKLTGRLAHLIGHSLGAHVAGYAGERLTDLGRITGLDPAEPSFQNMDPAVRLDPSDAVFVDVIHTDGSGYSTVSGYGMFQAVGHMDFYPNGGIHQPGCTQIPWLAFALGMYKMDMDGVESSLGCSHSRSYSLFTESINSGCKFTSSKCNDYIDFEDGLCFNCGQHPCPSMGYDSILSSLRGKFYLKTQPGSPFCGYQYFVTIRTGGDMRYASGVLSMTLVSEDGSSAETDIHRERRTFSRSREYKLVLLTAEEIQSLSGIRLQFESKTIFTWDSEEIIVSRISITVGISGETLYFCPTELSVGDDPVSLTTLSNDSSNCDQ